MATEADAEIIFGASFDKVSACAAGSATHPSTFVWNATNVAAWIAHMQAAELPVWAFELGNEVRTRASLLCLEIGRHLSSDSKLCEVICP